MSNVWFNIRLWVWHFQIEHGYLFRIRVFRNSYWVDQGWKALLRTPVAVCDFQPQRGWELRHPENRIVTAEYRP